MVSRQATATASQRPWKPNSHACSRNQARQPCPAARSNSIGSTPVRSRSSPERGRTRSAARQRSDCSRSSPALPHPSAMEARAMSNLSPRLQKGAILTFDPNTGVKLGTIMLQYNPDSLTRSLKPQTVGEEPDRTEILRLKGPPIETLKCDLEIDATDQLAASDPTATSLGIQPQLALLELLLYPSSTVLNINEVLSLLGTIEILPMETALTVFAWSQS